VNKLHDTKLKFLAIISTLTALISIILACSFGNPSPPDWIWGSWYANLISWDFNSNSAHGKQDSLDCVWPFGCQWEHKTLFSNNDFEGESYNTNPNTYSLFSKDGEVHSFVQVSEEEIRYLRCDLPCNEVVTHLDKQ